MADKRAAERAGRRAERAAAWLLRAKGYRILARRYRCSAGEIDLVAKRGGTYAFVEVKARAGHEAAMRSVTRGNWQRIAAAADAYQARVLRRMDAPVRFDLVTVVNGWPRHHVDAWRLN